MTESDRSKIADFDVTWLEHRSFFDSHYVLMLIKPALSKDLSFADNIVAIKFGDSGAQADFTLRNTSETPIKILWEQAAFIDFAGKSHRVIHKGVRLIDRDKPEAPTTVPPSAEVDDLIYPADYVELIGGSWAEPSMLPPSQDAPKYKGQQYSVFLPIEVNRGG